MLQLLSVQYVPSFLCSKLRFMPLVFWFYQHRSKMMNIMIYVPKFKFDERILKIEPIYRKYDKAVLVDNDLLDSFQFPALKREVYIELVMKDDGSISIKFKTNFRGIQWSTLLNLRSMPFFRTTRAAM